MNDFSTLEKRIIFDMTKVGIGDVIEFEMKETTTCLYAGEYEKVRRLAGIVISADTDSIQLLTGDRGHTYQRPFAVTTILASDDSEMRIVYRDLQNMK